MKFYIKATFTFGTFLVTFFTPNLVYGQTCTTSANATNEPKTYLVGAGKLSKKESKRLEEKWGKLTIPEGETKAALDRREFIQSRRQKKIEEIKGFYEEFKADPNSTPDEIEITRKEMNELIEQVTNSPTDKKRLAMKAFDWRKEEVDVGKIMNQGEGCNTCWAFAATDAAAGSLEKQYMNGFGNEEEYMFFYEPIHNLFSTFKGDKLMLGTPTYFRHGNPRPFVQDLLNCMPLKKEEMCNNGWHGKAFDYMVYAKGVPTSYEGLVPVYETGEEINFKREYKAGEKFACNPTNGFYGAFAWDYVNSPPDKLPTVPQLKQALIEHGPIVVPIVYDACLANYRGGVFNEENFGTVNHVVLLIGWDDEKEAWLIKNSWGEDWGEKGFAWIKYGSNNIGMFAAWIDADLKSLKSSPSDPLKSEPESIKTGCSDLNEVELLEAIYAEIKGKHQGDTPKILINDGVLTIDGQVETEKLRKKIYKIVKNFEKKNKCIKKIVNNLSVAKD